MAKLELTLYNEEGHATVYQENHVSGQALLDFWTMQIEIESPKSKLTIPDVIGKKAEYVASLFKNPAVTAEAIIKGVDSWDLLDVLDDLTTKAIGGDKEDPKQNQPIQSNPEENTLALLKD